MTRFIPLYIPAPLAAEYRRRREAHPTNALIIRSFPNSGNQRVSVETARLMLEDANRQVLLLTGTKATGALRCYEGLVRQIERRFLEIEEADKIAASVITLRGIIARWRQ